MSSSIDIKIIIRIFLTIIILTNASNSYAQKKLLSIGLKAGGTISNISEDLKEDVKLSFNAGITIDYILSPDVYLLTGLDYYSKGRRKDDANINLSYLSLPIHIGYQLHITRTSKIVLHAGPYIAYAINGKYKTNEHNHHIFDNNIVSTLGYKMKRFDTGIGLGFNIERNNICLGLGYDLGLINLVDIKDKSIISQDSKGKNMNTYLTLGYKF